MDKNKIKSFAIWARRKMIESVTEKAERIGIYKDKIDEAVSVQGGFKVQGKEEIFTMPKKHRDALVEQVTEKGFEQVMEEVAYTWFNRFMGLRYMEVNDYLPSGVRILSSEVEGKIEPDVLTKVSEAIDELDLNGEEIYELLDSGKTEDREKAYRIILVKQCNELGKIIAQMFEKISDYTELLLPDNLLEEGSVIRKMVEDIEETDWKEEVEIIGWMYQYYISEKKDEVFTALKKNVKITKENIPAATQLFTPKWIVKYMVENSLGRLWLEGHPNKELQKEWKYYLEEAEQEPEVEEELKKIREEHSHLMPEDIKVLDPCMGSGHILVYAFDVLYEIYKTAGYSEREIPRMILQNNLYGLDIDDRAAQLASFALIMKARHYNRRLFREIEREHLELNLCSIQESNSIHEEAIDYFCSLNTGLDNDKLRNDLEYLCKSFIGAKEYGSILKVTKINFESLIQRLNEIDNDDNLMFGDYRKILLDKIPIIIKQAEIMSIKYEVCITNPPYMGRRKSMNSTLSKYIDSHYANAKMDLFSVFMLRNIEYTKSNGILGYMTPFVWMFINSYVDMRKNLVEEIDIVNLIQLEESSFQDAAVSICTFTIRNSHVNYKGNYIKLSDFQGAENQELMVRKCANDYKQEYNYFIDMNKFKKIPDYRIAYWISEKVVNTFKFSLLGNEIDIKQGITTSDNERFLRLWYEINFERMGIGLEKESAIQSQYKWFPYNKGGGNRKWYGNNEYVINYENNGIEMKTFHDILNKTNPGGRLKNKDFYFKRSITWSDICGKSFAARFSNKGFLFDVKGSCAFPNEDTFKYILGFLNSSLIKQYLDILNPTVTTQVGDLKQIPVIVDKNNIDIINKLVDENIKISKMDWDNGEISWDFKTNILLNSDIYNKSLNSCVNNLKKIAFEQRYKLKNNEEKLNQYYLNSYKLSDEFKYEVDEDEIKIYKIEKNEIIIRFISYAVGCMLGRYSIDAEGLIYAGGDFNNKWNIDDNKVRKIEKDEYGNIISDSWVDANFIPDADNIIPITEDEYFEDDIVSRFIDFVRTVYGNDTLEENLDFIADSIGRKASETSRQAIRRYFLKDFYKDHLKVYQKRPIYWMFESGKNNGFKALIYMHRYNDQTVAKVRTEYLHILQRKYEAEIERLKLIVDSEEYTAKDRTSAKKKIDKITKQIEECKEYDEVVAYLANEKINIDLDDGVKVNYGKFQGISVINSKGKEIKMNLLSKI